MGRKDTAEIPCTNWGCEDGYIVVHNVYDQDPFKGKSQRCDVCLGTGFQTTFLSEPVTDIKD